MGARPGALLGLGAVLVAGCVSACRERPPPEIFYVDPPEVARRAPGGIRVEGRGFYANLWDPFWSGQPAELDARFRMWIGDVELPDGAVSQIDLGRLEVVLPAGLPLGLHPVRVRTPAGREASLADALAVVDSVTPQLSVEDAPLAGAPIGSRDLAADGSPLSAYAIWRSVASGRYLGAAPCAWALAGDDVGDLAAAPDGTSATLTPRRAGVAQLVAAPLDGGAAASTGDLRVDAPRLLPPRSPPLARLAITPGALNAEDSATLDANGSWDYQTGTANLQYSFDVDGTATGPPPWTPWSPSRSMAHTYTTEGSFTARVAVRDADGDVGYAAAIALVLRSNTKPCVVTAPWAAADDGATGCTGSPGPDQMLSLAEALRIGSASGGQFAVVLGPDLTVTGPADLTASGDIWVMGGVNTRLADVSLRVPGGSTLILSGVTLEGSTSLLSVDPLGVAVLEGVAVRNAPTLQVQGTLRLRRSELTGCVGPCVALTSAGASLSGRSTLFADAPAGIDATSCGADAGVDVVSCTFARLGVGLRSGAGCANTRIANDTVHGNGVGLAYASGSGHELRNVVFSNNGVAVDCGSAGFQRADFALLWSNADAGCAPADPATLAADPMYLMPDWSDFRLHLGSPAVDSGADAGLDVNDAAPGDFSGAAPDRGGRETW